jgi:hypothetical protein
MRKRHELEPVVQLDYDGRRFTFRVESKPPFSYWRIEWNGRVYRSPAHVEGDEQPEFFRNLVRVAIAQGLL